MEPHPPDLPMAGAREMSRFVIPTEAALLRASGLGPSLPFIWVGLSYLSVCAGAVGASWFCVSLVSGRYDNLPPTRPSIAYVCSYIYIYICTYIFIYMYICRGTYIYICVISIIV